MRDDMLHGGFVLKRLAAFFIFLLPARLFSMDPVSPNCEANFSNRQVGIFFDWSNFDEDVLGFKFKNGRYFFRYRRYSYPYLYGVKAGRENTFSPSENSLVAASGSFNYIFLEDTLITPSVLLGSEISVSRNFEGESIRVFKTQILFGKEFNRILPYFGPAFNWIGVNLGDDSKNKTAFNLNIGCKFYTSPGVSYGVDYTVGAMTGWRLYFNSSW